LVFNPCSIAFVPDIKPVWKEVYRVLAKGGIFMTGFYNPVTLLFNEKDVEDDNLILKYKMPYSDTESLSQNELQKFIDNAEPLIHGHSLNEIMGEQMRLGFQFTDMFEDTWDNNNNLNKHFPCFIATRAVK
jgi:ubiquinone/menaquinone biosynthesis C-methylase UbiE